MTFAERLAQYLDAYRRYAEADHEFHTRTRIAFRLARRRGGSDADYDHAYEVAGVGHADERWIWLSRLRKAALARLITAARSEDDYLVRLMAGCQVAFCESSKPRPDNANRQSHDQTTASGGRTVAAVSLWVRPMPSRPAEPVHHINKGDTHANRNSGVPHTRSLRRRDGTREPANRN